MMNELKSKITIERLTTVDDFLRDVIISIDEEAFGPGSLTKWSLPLFLDYGKVYLARYEGRPVGVAELMRAWNEPELIYLYGMAVISQYRGCGIGSLLLLEILKNLPSYGYKRLQLTVDPENQTAIHIYRDKFEMQSLKYIKNYFGPGEDRLLYEWIWDEDKK